MQCMPSSSLQHSQCTITGSAREYPVSRPLSKMRPGACQAGAHLCVMVAMGLPMSLPDLLSHPGKEAAAHEGAQGARRQEHRGRQPAQAGEDRRQRESAQAQHVPCTPPTPGASTDGHHHTQQRESAQARHVPCTPPRNTWRKHKWPTPHTPVALQLQQLIPGMPSSAADAWFHKLAGRSQHHQWHVAGGSRRAGDSLTQHDPRRHWDACALMQACVHSLVQQRFCMPAISSAFTHWYRHSSHDSHRTCLQI